jgi:hypothetical protein
MTTSEMFRQSARVRVVGVVTWWGFDLDDVVDDEGRFENSWIAAYQLCHQFEEEGRTIDINR